MEHLKITQSFGLPGDNNSIVENFKEEDIMFGNIDVGDDFLLVNHILSLGKYYIYSQKCQRVCPPFRGSLLGLGVFTTFNFTLPGKEAH